MDLGSLRKEYLFSDLRKKDLAKNPFTQFKIWFEEALKAKIVEPNAMALATVGPHFEVSNRMVLLKIIDDRGLVFFTSYLSRKAMQIKKHPKASAVFFWKELERQVCIEGSVEKITAEEGKIYFTSRPRSSQIASWASEQDQKLNSRSQLEESFEKFEHQFANQKVPKPRNWGGYRLIPHRFEFWQGRESRLHDRFIYREINGSWVIDRLSP